MTSNLPGVKDSLIEEIKHTLRQTANGKNETFGVYLR